MWYAGRKKFGIQFEHNSRVRSVVKSALLFLSQFILPFSPQPYLASFSGPVDLASPLYSLSSLAAKDHSVFEWRKPYSPLFG